MEWKEILNDYEKHIEQLESEKILSRQRMNKKGKNSAFDRISLLLDEGTFKEIGKWRETDKRDGNLIKDKFLGDGVITGYGKIQNKLVYVYSEDFSVMGGSLGKVHAEKIVKIQDMALKNRAPLICINDSGGARIEEGMASLNGYANIFLRHVKASGVIPQIAVILGPCAGGASYGPALCDFIFMVDGISKMFLTGPQVVKNVIGENVSSDELGGSIVHTQKTGIAHFSFENEKLCLAEVRRLVTYLMNNNSLTLEKDKSKRLKMNTIQKMIYKLVPANPRKPYDMKSVLNLILDDNSLIEINTNYAKNVIVGLGKIEGIVIGIIANQPLHMCGAIDVNASIKISRFVRMCDAFNIPLVVMVDVPAFMPGTKQETEGIIRNGAKIVFAFAEATVPKISIILRKAYGGAYIAMNSKGLGADVVYAWPNIEMSIMGADEAVKIIHKRDKDSNMVYASKEYREKFSEPYVIASEGYIDEIIKPDETREKIYDALIDLINGKKEQSYKHSNIPL